MLKTFLTAALFSCEFFILVKAFGSVATNMRGWSGTSTSGIRKGLLLFKPNHKLLPRHKIDTQRRSDSSLNSAMEEELIVPSVSAASKSNLFCTATFRSRKDHTHSSSRKVESRLGLSLPSKINTTVSHQHVKRGKQLKSFVALANILEETHNPVIRQEDGNVAFVSDTTTTNTDDTRQQDEFVVVDSFEKITKPVDNVAVSSTNNTDDTQRKDVFVVDEFEKITTLVDEPVLLREFRQETGVQIRKCELIEAGKNSNDLGERAFAMLLELNIVEINLDPDDPLYDHEFDSLYSPDNNWLA